MRMLPVLLLGTALATPAFALDACVVSATDPQTRICAYSPTQRYQVIGLVGFPVNLKFADGEQIKRREFGYTGVDKDGKPSATWHTSTCSDKTSEGKCPAGYIDNNMPIWPFAPGHSAMLVVTRLPDGKERPYYFDLTARPPAVECESNADDKPGCDGDGMTTASLVFTYPQDEARATAEKKAAALVAWRVQQAKKAEADGTARLKTDVFYGQRNFAYQAKGDRKKFGYLVPSEVSDNGYLTEFQWPGNVEVPTITILNPATGEERTVTPTVQGPMHIIDTTSEWFRLRLGPTSVIDVHNLHWTPERANPGTGTSSPNVVREVRYQDGRSQ